MGVMDDHRNPCRMREPWVRLLLHGDTADILAKHLVMIEETFALSVQLLVLFA